MTDARTSLEISRSQLADLIVSRLDDSIVAAATHEFQSSQGCQWFIVDDLLPEQIARSVYGAFPNPKTMRERKTIREHKYVAAQMNKYAPLGEEALFAFHDSRVVEKVALITGMSELHPDQHLYAGGLSLMGKNNFLNPHLDNSHNNQRTEYRVLNLLYYVSPDWSESNGGSLELWPNGLRQLPVTIPSRFNRLVVMTTGPESWHSVNRVKVDAPRCCVSNYYFSPQPVGGEDYFRVTTFRGRPEQPLRDLILRADATLRQAIRAVKPGGLVKTTHVYKRDGNSGSR
ncbi:MAG TPA: 2OG-Fe(II) oxygenase [Burkholderiaceae bacterium]|jgi:Rps23 Pro-64 3,4-dihydroxylase Tpa1-like proline 4-hydroxylase